MAASQLHPAYDQIRARLVVLRHLHGLSQRELAEAIGNGCTQGTLSALERGAREPLIGTLLRWTHALGWDLDVFDPGCE